MCDGYYLERNGLHSVSYRSQSRVLRASDFERAKTKLSSTRQASIGLETPALIRYNGYARWLPSDVPQIDVFDPENVPPTVACLAKKDCPAATLTFHLIGNRLPVISMPAIVHHLKTKRRRMAEGLDCELQQKLVNPPLIEESVKC